jgi:hypothetical protein
MSWTVNFEDGSSLTSKNTHWTSLPTDKRITGLQMQHPQMPKLYFSLTELDLYYYVVEAVASLSGDDRIVAKIIGGHNVALGVVSEVRMEENGSIKFRAYPISRFGYDRTILHAGVGKKGVRQTA